MAGTVGQTISQMFQSDMLSKNTRMHQSAEILYTNGLQCSESIPSQCWFPCLQLGYRACFIGQGSKRCVLSAPSYIVRPCSLWPAHICSHGNSHDQSHFFFDFSCIGKPVLINTYSRNLPRTHRSRFLSWGLSGLVAHNSIEHACIGIVQIWDAHKC